MSAEIDMKTYLPEDDFQPQVEEFVNTPQPEAVEAPQVVDQVAQQTQQTDKEVNFQAFRDEIKQKISEVEQLKAQRESDRREFQLQMELLKANAGQQPQREKKLFEGMNDDDVLNVRELRKEFESIDANYRARIDELEFQQSHPDYVDVLNNYLTPLIKEDPSIAAEIRMSSTPAATAYRYGVLAKRASPGQQVQPQEAQAPPQPSQTAQRIVENARKPATLAQAGGQSVLSKADYYATMSDKEFMELAQRNLSGI